MIQRIQSLYLFIGAILSVCLFIIPSFRLVTPEQTIVMSSCHINPAVAGISTTILVPLAVITTLMAFFCFYSIFLYKNRKKQMLVIRINMLVALAVLITGVVYALKISSLLNATLKPTGIVAIVVVLCCLYLAYRGVKKDDDLVKSADRLR
jgi:hypothetical protein